ncbi:MAG TPA: hypothetical protein VMM76_01625 [Pirellulaceae bacterium]|nr:hypothetical protein [Pirellulaceae bacterium]
MNVVPVSRVVCLVCQFLFVGCNTATPVTDDRIAPFAGRWEFDAEGTFALMEERIDNPDAIRISRQFHTNVSPLHQNLVISGTTLTGDGVPACEYQLFALHQHGDVLCGKAWHHEDRYDPGDMSKCFIQLEVVESKLKLTVNQLDGLPDLDDPDLHSPTPSSDADGCRTPALIGEEPKEWAVYCFDKRGA